MNQESGTADPQTRAFLMGVVKVLLDFITSTNNREEKVVDFVHPDILRNKLDLKIPENPLTLEQLIEDCKAALEHQVKTGKNAMVAQTFIFILYTIVSKNINN